jgi:hypothetical protein
VEKTMSEGGKQDVGITIKNEGQDAQPLLFARINGHAEGGPQVVDQAIIDPGAEIQTTLAAGLVVQISNLPDGMQAANDDNAQSQSDSGS